MDSGTVVARRVTEFDAAGFPATKAWAAAQAISFDWDWRGENADAQRSTEVRVMWTAEMLYLRFVQRYRTITAYADARQDGWRDELWDRDVAEAFLQPDSSDARKYLEFEVAPNGQWIDLLISHGTKAELGSKLKRRVVLDEAKKTWTAELAIPMQSLTKTFSASDVWRVNFFRVEGEKEPRFYSAWRPTKTEVPQFHVPEAFGRLIFE
jgi:alpha-galactosidase